MPLPDNSLLLGHYQGIYDGFDEQTNDLMIFIACWYYQDLGNQSRSEQLAFGEQLIAMARIKRN